MKLFYSFILYLGLTFQACNSQTPSKIPKTVPEFTFYTIKGNLPVTRTSLAVQGNIVFLFFDPGCSHCRTEVTAIGDNFNKFKNATFYLVSPQGPALVTDFMNTYGKKIQNQENVHVLLDKNYDLGYKFYPTQYPAVYIYGPDRKLKSYFDGEQSIERIIKEVNN